MPAKVHLCLANQEPQKDVKFESTKQFAQEKIYIDKIRKMRPQDFYADIDNIEKQYKTIESVDNEVSFIKYQDLFRHDIKE